MTTLLAVRTGLTAAGLLLAVAWIGPSQALAESAPPANGRAFSVGVHAGLRSFDSDLDLEREAAVGLRLGLGASERVSVLLDFLYSSPARETTGAAADVIALRGLGKVRLLLGAVRPYVLAGAGGLLFDFSDASDAAGGTLTLGGGFELRPARRVSLALEGSADLYRARTVLYSSTGSELSSTERSTKTATAALAGVAWEF